MRRKRKNVNIRKNKNVNDKQVKKMLATRLIAISMKIDEHIYKNKAISVTEAVAFIDEMTTCRILCSDDARSLQVIEKITRCMQAIIMENQHSLGGNNAFENTSYAIPNQNTCPSPVYSLPDEDKDLYSQATVVTEHTVVKTLEKNAPEIETINICSDDEDVTSAQKVLVDVEIHRAMSNLSIRNEIPLGTPEDCSQSILNNLLENPNGTQNLKDTENSETRKQSMIDKVLKNVNSGEQHVEYPKKVANTANIDQGNSKPAKFVCPKVRFQDKNLTLQKVVGLTENTAKKKTRRKRQTQDDNKKENKIPKRNLKNNKEITATRKSKTDKDQKVSFQTYSTPINPFDKLENQKPSKVPNVNPDNNIFLHGINVFGNIHQNAQTKMIKSNVPNQIQVIAVPKIYTPTVQDDLSWMENIRYVREIHTDEFDSTLSCVDDAFWNNCAFPNEWNEQEFDYLV